MDEDIVQGDIMKEGIIYCAYNKVNGKRYIGQTIQRLCERKAAHYNKDADLYFHKALRKYSPENWEWTIIDYADNKEALNDKEIYWIAYYDTTNPNKGYNIQSGGQGANQTLEQIRYAREQFVKQHGVEYIISNKLKNIRCVETGIVYKNAAEASRQTNIAHSHITEAANGILNSAGGYTWEWCLELKFFPNAIYCKELDKTYLSFNEAKRIDNFSGTMLSRAFKEQGSPCIYAGYTFYKINNEISPE